MKKINPVVHFEMPAEDSLRMAGFYTRVFGWQAQMMGEEMGKYESACLDFMKSGELGNKKAYDAIIMDCQ